MSFARTYQNSWTTTCSSGLVIYEPYFDAWGKRRNADSWEYNSFVADPDFSWVRGFTGHEHHDEFGIINMNNRMYDPVIARMMGTDNYVQSPYFTQSYNRYSYVWNNPMSYTDPSGDVVHVTVTIGIGAVVGTYLGGSVANNSFNPAEWSFERENGLGKTVIGMATGGLLGVAGGYAFHAGISGAYGVATKSFLTSSKLKAGILSGGMNAFKNYQSGQSALASFGYFASGFWGGYYGIQEHVLVGMAGSALGNGAVYGGLDNGEKTFYGLAQKMVSGALSAYSGVSAFGKINYLQFENGDYFMGSKTAAKAAHAGWYNVVSDWAHTSQYDWNKREHKWFSSGLAWFGGFLGGAISAYGMEEYQGFIKRDGFGKAYLTSLGYNTAAGAVEYSFTQFGHALAYGSTDYLPWGYQYGLKKAAIWSYKSLMYGFTGKIAK